MGAQPSSITFESVAKSFPLGKGNYVRALQNFSLTVAPGELLALVGPSGSGKTTALRLVAGLEAPDGGKIFISGRDMADVDPKNRGVGMVFQNHALYPHLSARENLAFGLEIQKLPRAEIVRRIENVSRVLHLVGLLDKRPEALSGGERQRVALGRAIVSQPKILLLDEPFSNLDPQLRTELRDEIRKLRHEFDLTILLVTHDQPDALALADRIGVIQTGQLGQIGSPEQIYQEPSNRFVASFFGEMNFLHGQLSNGKFVLPLNENHVIGFELRSMESVRGFAEGKDLLLGFRPEAISLQNESKQSSGDYSATFQIEALGIEYAGSFYRICGKLGVQTIVLNANHHQQRAFLDVTLDLRKVHLFDATTGQAV